MFKGSVIASFMWLLVNAATGDALDNETSGHFNIISDHMTYFGKSVSIRNDNKTDEYLDDNSYDYETSTEDYENYADETEYTYDGVCNNHQLILQNFKLPFASNNYTINAAQRLLSLWNEAMSPLEQSLVCHWNKKVITMWHLATPKWSHQAIINLNKTFSALWSQITNSSEWHFNQSHWNKKISAAFRQYIERLEMEISEVVTQEAPYDDEESVTVTLEQGAIAGVRESAGGSRFFYSFRGIPYAQPPVGNLRFKEPVPASKWAGIRNGRKDPPVCPQLQFYITIGAEDCLYLNVYTPKLHNSELPVMVWFHGGNFLYGGADSVPPLPLLTKDIVLVVIQYRLGTLGFLSTEDDVLPGNLGLKDQTVALKWVQQNIHHFGGDPSEVTLAGQSAGSCSVHFQVMSPKARGLFQRVIMQSGTALSPWATRIDHRHVAETISKKFNCMDKDGVFNSTEFLQCLHEIPLSKIVEMPLLFTLLLTLPTVMTPRVDGDFLPDHPATLLKEGRFNQVCAIIGFNEHEGAFAALPFVSYPFLAKNFMDNFEVAGPALMNFDKEKTPYDMAQKTYSHYLNQDSISVENIHAAVQMNTDLGFIWDHVETIRLHNEQSLTTYAYEFQYKGQYSTADIYGLNEDFHWVDNGDELNYIFNYKTSILERSEDLNKSIFMVKLWTNFVSTGNPTPDNSTGITWLTGSKACPKILVIERNPHMQSLRKSETMAFWKSLSTRTFELLYQQQSSLNSLFEIQTNVPNC